MNERNTNFSWYEVMESTDDIEQGDFIDDFPVIIPKKNVDIGIDAPLTIEGITKIYDVIVMTQSCDFQKMTDDDFVILCARYSFSYLKEKQNWGKGKWGNLIKGNLTGAHLLSKGDFGENSFDYQVVYLKEVFSVPLYIVKSVIKEREFRIRLLPPYSEHLSQGFARLFMRVGLPIDLPREYPYKD